MEIYEMIDLQDCPRCLGPSLLEEVDHGFYVTWSCEEDSWVMEYWQGNLYRLWRLIIYVCIVLKYDIYVCVQCYYD